MLQAAPVESSRRLASSVIHYVARVGDSVVLADSSRDDRFSNDPYIQEHQPLSLLCTPILHQGMLIGLLYLGEQLGAGSFHKSPCRFKARSFPEPGTSRRGSMSRLSMSLPPSVVMTSSKSALGSPIPASSQETSSACTSPIEGRRRAKRSSR